MIRDRLRRIERRVRPHAVWRRLQAHTGEAEMALLPSLCDPERSAVDVGAADGVYTAKAVLWATRCVSFEPRPVEARRLQRLASAVRAAVTVEQVALSSQAGSAVLHVPEAGGCASLEGDAGAAVTVPTRRLDDYGLDDVGFVKIDVEGHELAVLEGARDTIEANWPALLVEAEDRHREGAVASVVAFLAGLGYEGRFLLDGVLVGMDRFDPAAHQNPSNLGGATGWERRGVYVNNFVFTPR